MLSSDGRTLVTSWSLPGARGSLRQVLVAVDVATQVPARPCAGAQELVMFTPTASSVANRQHGWVSWWDAVTHDDCA